MSRPHTPTHPTPMTAATCGVWILLGVTAPQPSAAERRSRDADREAAEDALTPELERVLGSRYEVFHELSDRARPGRILIRGPDGYETWKSDCVEAEPQRYARVDLKLQNALSGGVRLSLAGMGGQAERSSSLSLTFTDPQLFSLEAADLLLRETCVERLAAEASSGRLRDLVLVQEALFARINGCKEVETSASAQVRGRGARASVSVGCQIFSDEPVAVGFRGQALVDLPQLRHLQGLLPVSGASQETGGTDPIAPRIATGATSGVDSVDILADVQRRQQSLDSAAEREAAVKACLEKEEGALRDGLLETWIALMDLQGRDHTAAADPMAALVSRYRGAEVSCTDSLGQEHRQKVCAQPGSWAWLWQCSGGLLDASCMDTMEKFCAEFSLIDIAQTSSAAVGGATLEPGTDLEMAMWPAQTRAGAALLRQECAADNALACARMGADLLYATGGFSRDEPRALSMLRDGCNNGISQACDHLSTHYGARSQLDVSHRYEVRACELGLARACSGALIYNEDAEEVQQLLQRGCELGDAELCAKLDKTR